MPPNNFSPCTAAAVAACITPCNQQQILVTAAAFIYNREHDVPTNGLDAAGTRDAAAQVPCSLTACTGTVAVQAVTLHDLAC